jgi:tRNA(Ile)-lysidine synthase
MSSLVNDIKQVLEEEGGHHYFIAISSGKDSVALAHAVHSLGFPVTFLHVNYHLRGEESNEDQRWLENFAKSLDVELIVHDVNFSLTDLKKGNLQQIARDIRYSFFEKKLLRHKNSFLLVAHHQHDQLENFWLHLFRNSGRSGLMGMSVRKNKIIRPMLKVNPKDITAYLIQNGIEWREDSSNKKNNYLRNSIRNRLLPELSLNFPTLSASILLIQEKLGEQEKEDEIFIQRFLTDHKNIFLLEELHEFSDDKLLLFIKSFGLKGSQLGEFRNFLISQSGAKFIVNTSSEFLKDRKFIAFITTEKKANQFSLNVKEVSKLPEIFDKISLYVNKEKIKGELFIRFWQEGDRIFPLGINGSKLLSDVFTTAKIPNSQKISIPLICDEEHILWCYGLVIDRRKIANNNDNCLMKITIEI